MITYDLESPAAKTLLDDFADIIQDIKAGRYLLAELSILENTLIPIVKEEISTAEEEGLDVQGFHEKLNVLHYMRYLILERLPPH